MSTSFKIQKELHRLGPTQVGLTFLSIRCVLIKICCLAKFSREELTTSIITMLQELLQMKVSQMSPSSNKKSKVKMRLLIFRNKNNPNWMYSTLKFKTKEKKKFWRKIVKWSSNSNLMLENKYGTNKPQEVV